MKNELTRNQSQEELIEVVPHAQGLNHSEYTHIVIFPAGFIPGLVMDYEKIRRLAANDEERQRKKDKKKPPKPPRRPNVHRGGLALGNT
jgi:hypothetical protein